MQDIFLLWLKTNIVPMFLFIILWCTTRRFLKWYLWDFLVFLIPYLVSIGFLDLVSPGMSIHLITLYLAGILLCIYPAIKLLIHFIYSKQVIKNKKIYEGICLFVCCFNGVISYYFIVWLVGTKTLME